jgi:Fe-S cluster assembly scaffold protein SufB
LFRVLQEPVSAHLAVSSHKVLGKSELPGLRLDTEETQDGIRARISIEPGVKLQQPIHFCIGLLGDEGTQSIDIEYELGEETRADFIAHCTFPDARKVVHRMDARVHLGAGARLRYTETHFHGPHGGTEVIPHGRVRLGEGAQYLGAFNLVRGRVGRLDSNYEVDAAEAALVELDAKAYGRADDEVVVTEVIRLNGIRSHGVTKTRLAARDQARTRVFTQIEGNAAGARGHMDCAEVVRGDAIAENIPQVIVRNEQAQVTHEAAIGRISNKELETLMARGLDEEAAVDVIVKGMLQ